MQSSNDELKKTYKLLLVDDSELNTILFSTAFESHGHDVTTAENGIKAIEKVKQENFDAIIMDIEMPIMNGIEATKIIRGFDQQTPIIAFSSNDDETNEKKYINYGFDGFFSKLVDVFQFETSIIDIISKKKN